MKKYYIYRFISTTLAVTLGILIAAWLLAEVL